MTTYCLPGVIENEHTFAHRPNDQDTEIDQYPNHQLCRNPSYNSPVMYTKTNKHTHPCSSNTNQQAELNYNIKGTSNIPLQQFKPPIIHYNGRWTPHGWEVPNTTLKPPMLSLLLPMLHPQTYIFRNQTYYKQQKPNIIVEGPGISPSGPTRHTLAI